MSALCPCGSGRALSDCCGRFVFGGEAAPDPEALMRSRYSAYALGAETYLLETWSARQRPRRIFEPGETPVQWVALEILGTSLAKKGHRGTVTFRATGRDDEGLFVLQEKSRFERHDGRWVYVDGETAVERLPGLPEAPQS